MTPARDLRLGAAAPSEPWRFMVLASAALHVAAFGLVLVLPRLLSIPRSAPPVQIVDLVSLPSGAPVAAPAPARGAAEKPAAPRPPAPPPQPREKPVAIPERGTRPTPSKTPKKAPDTPAPAPTPRPSEKVAPPAQDQEPEPQPSATPAPAGGAKGTAAPGVLAGSGAQPGGAGGTGAGATDEYSFYYSLLERKIKGAWKKPIYPPQRTEATPLLAKLRLSLSSSGRVTGLDLIQSSGYDALDRSVQRAVQDAEPFPPFPYQLGTGSLTVAIEFELTPEVQ